MKQAQDEVEQVSENEKKTGFKPTMEIPLFLVMFGTFLSGNVVTNILLHRTCINTLGRPESECELLLDPGPKSNETAQLESETQQFVTIVRMTLSVTEAVIPAILSLFLGVWSNRYGRKPLLIWPLLGMSISAVLVVVYSALGGLGPWWFLLTAIPFSVSGGYSAFFTGMYSYITDITKESERSSRITLLEAASLIGNILGTLGGPYLLGLLGNIILLSLAAGAFIIAFVFTFVFVHESVQGAKQGNLASVLDFSLIKEMAKTCVKKRPNKDRTILFLLIACSTFTVPYTSALDYLYTRNKLQWTLETYSIYSVVNTVSRVVGLILGVTLLQKVFKINDGWLTLLSYLSAMADYVVRALAVVMWHMYLATSVSIFRGLAHPLIRSILSKILPAEDTAKIFSLLSILNVTMPLIAPLIVNPLYTSTIDVVPGSMYLLCASIHVANFIMMSLVKYFMWKYPSTPSEKESFKTKL